MEPQSTNKIDNPLNAMSPGEQVVCNIKRHPIGLLGVYVMSVILLVILFGAVGTLPSLVGDLSATDRNYAFVAAVSLTLLILLFTYIASIIYKGNRWIVTSDSITQIQQTGLFRKQTSQLSLENLEDVTFEQSSILQTMFGYGTLKVETAGEHSKFQFPYCPAPQKCAVEIIEAHERFMSANMPGAANSTLNTGVSSNGPTIPGQAS